MSKKMRHCAVCGEEIASSAKVCPKCGAANKKPIYQRGWFIVIMVLVILTIIVSMSGTSEGENENISYTVYTVDQLMEDLDKNAANASSVYKDQYVELTGRLAVIDSDGKYVSIHPLNDKWSIVGVLCSIENEEQKNVIMKMAIGDTVVVRGKITRVGEALGYYLDIDDIEKK